MPLPLGHAAIGFAMHNILSDDKRSAIDWRVAIVIIVLSNLPDIDVVFGLILQGNGNAFHRGPTHSILFSLVLGYAIYRGLRWWGKTPVLPWQVCMAIIFSHIVADQFLTSAPVSFFWPFEVHWTAGEEGWYHVFHAVFFGVARDGAIVCACAMIVIANTLARRLLDHAPSWKGSRG